MPKNTPDALASIAVFESRAFRASQLARQLCAQNPELPLNDVKVMAFSGPDSPRVVTLDLDAPDVDSARSWAQVLGIELKSTVNITGSGYEYVAGTTKVDGIQVNVSGLRLLRTDEIAKHRAEQAQPGDAA